MDQDGRDRRWTLSSREAATTQRKWLALAVICAAQFIYLMDMFLLNVSAPAIRAEFESSAVLKSVFAANQIAFAAFVFFGGRLGDLFGRKRLFLIGLAGAGMSAMAAAFADIATALILARALQGFFGALFVPQIMAILVGLFDDAERAPAIGVYGMVIGFGGAAGFLSGGLIVEFAGEDLGWRSVFLLIGPSLLLLAASCLAFLPATPPSATSKGLSLVPSLLLFGAGVLLIGPIATVGLVSPAFAALALFCGAGLVILLVRLQRRRMASGAPALVSQDLAQSGNFKVGVLICFLFFIGNISFYLTTTLYLTDAFQLSALALGLCYTPMGLGFVLGARGGSLRMRRVGPTAIREGLTLKLVCLLVFALVVGAGAPGQAVVVALLIPFGFAQGFTMGPLIGFIVAQARPVETGAASGAQQASQQFGNAAGVAALSTLYFAVLAETSPHTAIAASLAALAVICAAALLLARRLKA